MKQCFLFLFGEMGKKSFSFFASRNVCFSSSIWVVWPRGSRKECFPFFSFWRSQLPRVRVYITRFDTQQAPSRARRVIAGAARFEKRWGGNGERTAYNTRQWKGDAMSLLVARSSDCCNSSSSSCWCFSCCCHKRIFSLSLSYLSTWSRTSTTRIKGILPSRAMSAKKKEEEEKNRVEIISKITRTWLGQ